MLLKLIRFVRGTVDFEISGGYLERFINLCGKAGIPLRNIKRDGGSLTAGTSYMGGKRLRETAARAGVNLRLIKRGGAPSLLRRYRLRAGLFAGAVLLLALPFILSMFLWRIDIAGSETIPEQELLHSLASLGVRVGARRGGIDARNVERRMMLLEGRLAWIAVNMRGSTAYVELRERAIAPPRLDTVVPHNIIASKNGFITNMMVYEGQPLVKNGDSVLAGDILVSGIMEDVNGKNRTVHSRAKIEAQIEDCIAVTIPYAQTVTYLTDEGLTEERSITINAEEARHEATLQLLAREDEAFPPETVISRELTGQELEDSFILFADYIRTADIAEECEILR
ncbi:MAG: sporulation protein YqfD [Angelakisella sp.]